MKVSNLIVFHFMLSDEDPVGIWDARPYFEFHKNTNKKYRHELLTSLPRLPFDLEYGDLAIVYHSVNTYTVAPVKHDKIPSFNEATTALSMNLYGVALISKYNSCPPSPQ